MDKVLSAADLKIKSDKLLNVDFFLNAITGYQSKR